MADPFPTCYLNGEYLPLMDARVSPLDRAFLYADSVYEVLPVYRGRPFRLAAHCARLNRSLGEIRMAPPLSDRQWAEIIAGLAERNGGGDLYVYVQVSRGAEYGRNHSIPKGVAPTIFGFAAPLPVNSEELLTQGMSAITVEDLRWGRCDIKSTALLPNVLAKQDAADAGAHEAILLRDGKLMEGSSTTIHVVRNGILCVPPDSRRILPGTTRNVVLELAQRAGIAERVAEISREELFAADEVWLAAATREVIAITRIDGLPVGNGRPGPLWRRVYDLFQQYKRELENRPVLP
ncbi:MAG TPA: D-amino acid aminotransferase [Steroidobacteraceae bacterium]|nr:D-amino acid aminotransferase [Steroidobacteraceae bacterium]